MQMRQENGERGKQSKSRIVSPTSEDHSLLYAQQPASIIGNPSYNYE